MKLPVAQQLASHIILESSDGNNNSENDPIKLSRPKGRRLRVYLHKRKRKKSSMFQVSHVDLDKLKVKLKLSKTKSKVLAQGIRHVCGSRKAVAPGYKEHLVQTSRDQEQFLTVDHIKVKKSTKKSEEEVAKDVVHIRDLQQYFDHIRTRRNISPADCLLKLMGDTGGNFFKYCMQVIDMTRVLKEKRGRACLSNGLFSNEYNDNGVNKILILAIVAKENVSECYSLVSKVLKLMNLNVQNCKRIIRTGDQKFVNIITGLGAHTSSYPSPQCFIFHKNLLDPCPAMRDIDSLQKDVEKFKTKKMAAAKCHNVINENLIPGEGSDLIADLCPPQELHLMLRGFNKIWHQMAPLWADLSVDDDEPAKTFAVGLNVVAASYHVGDFKGPGTKKNLSSLEKLEDILP